MKKVVVIGCGIAALGALRKFREHRIDYKVFEKESRPGGLCRTVEQDGFLFDYTGHLLHFRNDIFKKEVFSLIGDTLLQKQRSAWIYSKDVFTRYPFQANLFGLPEEVVVECIYEFSRQYFKGNKITVSNFAQWIEANFGCGISKHFMAPYNQKLYRCALEELSPESGGRFVPKTDLKLLLRGALSEGYGGLGYNATFFYPRKDGIELLVKKMSENIVVNLEESVDKINITDHTVTTSRGKSYQYDYIISTIPLNDLINSIENVSDRVREYSSQLKYVSVLNVNVGFRENHGTMHWVYIPEEKYLFHRLGFIHNFSENMVPTGCGSLYTEISYRPDSGINQAEAVEKCLHDAKNMKILNGDKIATVNVLNIPYGYVLFDHNRKEAVGAIKEFLQGIGIFSAGRFGSWEYFSMEDAFMDGWDVACKVEKRLN